MIDNKIVYDKDNLKESLDEFYSLYEKRPINDNHGGMTSSHLFNTWYALRQLKPKLVIESGVWKGLGTWVIEQALPEAKIISIDVTWQHLKYQSPNSMYLDQDMTLYDWEKMFAEAEEEHGIAKSDILVFLDDHQDFPSRLKFLSSLGIQSILYEDNYPPSQGDTLSPKKILACQDYVMDYAGDRHHHQYSYEYYDMFTSLVETYQELPPIYKTDQTRWGDPWTEDRYPTKEPLMKLEEQSVYPIFAEEAKGYTWICYMGLKNET